MNNLMRSPRTVDIEITSRCNLRCRYCYYFDNANLEYRDLPTAEWLKFFDELGAAAVMDVCLAGGEPFIRDDLPALLEGIVGNRMRFTILSNGSLIDDSIAATIAATGRCDVVQVSIDGADPETHDPFRGRGSFASAVRGIRTLQRHDVPVTSRITIHRRNAGDLAATARFLLEELELPDIGTNAAGYFGSCRRGSEDIQLTTADRQRAMETLLALAEKYPGRIQASAGPLAEARLWNEMEEARTEGAPPFSDGGRLTACGCPTGRIAVRADGVYVPCPMLGQIALGRINDDDFLEIWQKSAGLERMRRRHLIPLTDFAECADCGHRDYCTGNCPGLAYTLTGEVDRPSPDACLRRYLADCGRLPAMAREKVTT